LLIVDYSIRIGRHPALPGILAGKDADDPADGAFSN
jgi:hypothetical protein